MTEEQRKRAVRALTVVAGLVVAAATVLLVADFAAARLRAADDERIVLELEEQTRTDATAAAELEAERERQTERSLARETRGRRLGWVLLVASAIFVTGAKQLVAERGRTAPAAAPLVQLGVKVAATEPAREAPAGEEARSRDRAEPGEEQIAVDLAFVDGLVAELGRSREAAIPILQAIQTHYRYLPDEALRRVAELTEITPAQIAGTASFYAQFRRTPVGEHMVRICHGTACHVAGVEHVTDELRRQLGIPDGGDTDPRRLFTLDPVACLGCCSLAPVMMIDDETAGHLTPGSAWETLQRRVPRQRVPA